MSEMLTFIKRRFSSTDLTADGQETSNPKQSQQHQSRLFTSTNRNQSVTQPYQRYNSNTHRTTELSQSAAMSAREQMGAGYSQDNQSQNVSGSKKVYPSAPSSPSRSAGLGNFGSNQTTGLGGNSSNYFAGSMSQITKGIFSAASNAANTVRDKTAIVTGLKSKTLLVIDEPFIDWSKIFRGRKVLDDYDIRVEQGQFSEISVTSNMEKGCICTITNQNSKQTKSFRPDFVLIRQSCSDINHDWSNIIVGLSMGQVMSLNNLYTILHMKNKGWVSAHLLQIRNHLGKEAFPLISKTYHSSNKELNNVPTLPCVVKIGDGHFGDGKMKIENPVEFQDLTSISSISDKSILIENYVEAKCNFIIQKIGLNYRAFLRKSIAGNWKINVGSSILEKTLINDKMKVWVDEVSKLFGGLDICSVNGIISKTGEYHIIGVCGSDTVLLGETQEDDRRLIADLVVNKWNASISSRPLTKVLPKSPSMSGGDVFTRKISGQGPQPAVTNPLPPPPPPAVTQVPFSNAPTPPQKPVMTSAYGDASSNLSNPTSTSSLFSKKSTDLTSDDRAKPLMTQQPLRPTIGNTIRQTSSIGAHSTSQTCSYAPQASISSTGPSSSLFSGRTQIQSTDVTSQSTSGPYQPKNSSLFSSSKTNNSFNTQPVTENLLGTADQLPPPPTPPSTSVQLSSNLRQNRPLSQTENPLDETDDTMKNLRKTFAGIFGDM